MKVELIKEVKYPQAPWFRLMLDDEFQWGTFVEEDAKRTFEKMKEDPFMFKKSEEILQSEEIIVPL